MKNLNLLSDFQTEIIDQITDLKGRATKNVLLFFKNGVRQRNLDDSLTPTIVNALSTHIIEYKEEFSLYYDKISDAYISLHKNDEMIKEFRALLDCSVIFRGYYSNNNNDDDEKAEKDYNDKNSGNESKAISFLPPKIIDYDLNKDNFSSYKEKILFTH